MLFLSSPIVAILTHILFVYRDDTLKNNLMFWANAKP